MGDFCTVLVILITVLWKDTSFTKAIVVEETSHVRLSCLSVPETQRLVVNYHDNVNETLAVFTNSKCYVTRGDVRCFPLDSGINTLSIVEIAVSSQTRNIVSYACGDGAPVNVTFYAKPFNVSCGPPTLDEAGANVIVKCTIDKIYPQPGCDFYDTTHNTTLNGTILPVKYEPWGSPVYYTSECSIQVSSLTPVHQMIQVYVYPKIDIKNGAIYGSNYTVASPLIIETVNITIDPSCPQGTSVIQDFIKIGTRATCTCLKTSSAAVLGRVHWYRNNQRVPANETDSSFSTLPLSYPKDFNQTFQCNASPFVSEPTSITFNPKFAFGPFSILGDFDQTTIDLCSVDTSTIPINVWVSRHDVNPDIIVKANVEIVSRSPSSRDKAPQLHFRPHTNLLSANITSTIYLNVTSGGKYVATVTFVNTIFNDLSVGRNISIIVREPPTQLPIFMINGGKPMKEGIATSNVNVTCYAPGGYPEVSEIKISCIGLNSTKSGNKLTVVMNFDMQDNGAICFCQATHTSGCYNNNVATAIVNIAYAVEVLNFKANNSTVFGVKEGQTVTLQCLAESSTSPVFTIEMKDDKSNGSVILTPEPRKVGDNVWQYQYTLPNAKCEDIHYYTCKATNVSSGLTLESYLSLGVNCTFRLKNLTEVDKRFSAVLGQDLVFALDVLGNPLPTEYQLLRGLHKYSLENGSFHVEFTPLKIPFGILKLTLFNVQREDMTLFSLVVYNGMEENMTYDFLLFEGNVPTCNEDLKLGLIVESVLFALISVSTIVTMLIMRKRHKRLIRRYRGQHAVELSRNSENDTSSEFIDDEIQPHHSLRDALNSDVENTLVKETQPSGVYRNRDIPEEFTNPTAGMYRDMESSSRQTKEILNPYNCVSEVHMEKARTLTKLKHQDFDRQRSIQADETRNADMGQEIFQANHNNDEDENIFGQVSFSRSENSWTLKEFKYKNNSLDIRSSVTADSTGHEDFDRLSSFQGDVTGNADNSFDGHSTISSDSTGDAGFLLTNLSSQVSKKEEEITEDFDRQSFFQACVARFEGLTRTNTSKPYSEKGKAKTEGSVYRSEKIRTLNAVGLSSMNPSLISEHDEEKKENNVTVNVLSKPDPRNLDVGPTINNSCQNPEDNVTVNEPSEPILSRPDVDNATVKEPSKPNLKQPDEENAAGPSRVGQKILPYSVTVLYPRYERDRTAIFKVLNPSESSGNSILSSVINPSETSGNTIDSIVMNTSESRGNIIIQVGIPQIHQLL